MPAVIGTSGWQYRHWRGRLYPAGLPQARWLEHYAQRFAAVEVNATFYRLPAPATFAAWRRRTPEGFVIAVKASRYLTHVRRLREPEDAVARLMAAARELGPRLGPILVQLPPDMRRDLPRLEATLTAFPAGVRVTVEPRHASWIEPETMELLERHDAALCMADRPTWRPPPRRTASWGYLRLHEGRASPRPCYGERALDTWARRLAELFSPEETVYAFFNNDPEGCAPRDARVFARSVARAGLSPTRVPGPSETPVGGDARRRRTRGGDPGEASERSGGEAIGGCLASMLISRSFPRPRRPPATARKPAFPEPAVRKRAAARGMPPPQRG